MSAVFSQLTLADIHHDVARNIVSLGQLPQLFDDLTDDPAAWLLAHRAQEEVKLAYRSKTPIIDRPFEDARWLNAIAWPFKHWQASRFSDGSYGVWYGSESVETTVYESAYHWHQGLLCDAGYDRDVVISERTVYWVACSAALLDFRTATEQHPDLLHPSDYRFCQAVGARIRREGHPGLLTQSVRRHQGENVAIFNPMVLSNPRHHCQLTYRLEAGRIVVEQQPGSAWISLEVANFS
jgi:hypothetical protein